MHNGSLSFDQKNDHDQPRHNEITTTTVTTATTSLIPAVSTASVFPVITEITRGIRAVEELRALARDISHLLQTEIPKIVRLTEILTRHASALFPFAEGESISAKILSAITDLTTWGINPAAALFGVQQAVGVGIASMDEGQYSLQAALRSAGEPTFDSFDVCVGLYSLYNMYTELNRLYDSVKFCTKRLKISAEEIAILTGSDKAFEEIQANISEWWNAPGSIFDYLEIPHPILEQLKSIIDLYEGMEPLRLASYFAITTQTEPNRKSQLDQITHLLTNACYNTLLNNIGAVSNSIGNTLGNALPAVGIKQLKKLGTKAALTASVTAIAGVSCPITVAILVTCASNQKTRNAFIAYGKSLVHPLVGEAKSDEGVHFTVSSALCALENGKSNFVTHFNTNISKKINAIMEQCASVSGSVTGAVFEQAIRTLIEDSALAKTLREQLDSVIYQILDGTLRQTLQIPDEKVYLENMENMEPEKVAVYQACGALIPEMANLLALPEFVENQLQIATGNPHICYLSETPLSFKKKAIQGATRALRLNVEGNIAAASFMLKGSAVIVNKGLALKKAIMGTAPESVTDLTLLGSSANRQSKKFDYVKQARLQQEILANRQKRVEEQKQAIELQNIEAEAEAVAIAYGFNKAFFENISNIQERATALLTALDGVDLWCIERDVPDAVATYVRKYLVTRSDALQVHMHTANKCFENLQIDKKPSTREKLVAIKHAISHIDSGMTPETKTHYLALLKLQHESIAGLEAPLETLYKAETEADYTNAQILIEAYLKENPTNAGLILADVVHFKKTFWRSYPANLLKLEQFLLGALAQNKSAENAVNVVVHCCPKEENSPAPALLFASVAQPNVANVASHIPVEHKDMHEDAEQRAFEEAVCLPANATNTTAKIELKTIAGWELTEVETKGDGFYEAVALQLNSKNFPVATHFPATTLEGGQTALAAILRHLSTPPEFQNRDWASEEDRIALTKALKVVIAIVDTRTEKDPHFVYHFVDWEGIADSTTNKADIPSGQLIVELAYTGKHYMSVTSTPANMAPKSTY